MQMLVKRARRGDAEAFVELMESCKSSMYRVAKGFFQCEDDVADVMAETVLLAYEHISELKNVSHFKTWLIRILINSCNRLKREQKKYELVGEERETGYIENSYSDLEFREMISAYPEDCQMILLLYYGERFTTREIAEVLGMNENTVRSKLRRTRENLRDTILFTV